MMASGGVKAFALGAMLLLGVSGTAEARAHASHHRAAGASGAGHTRHNSLMHGSALHGFEHESYRHHVVYAGYVSHHGGYHRYGHGRHAYASRWHGGGGIQCVTFARSDSGIQLSGNANTWWYHAAGVYARGARPEPGSVLNFRANGHMRMGHVAVVTEVVNSRTIQIDQANWAGPGATPGGVSRAIAVVDVSPANDWSAVRVGLGHSGEFGSIYPTYGFIYNRPYNGTLVAATVYAAPVEGLNPPPRDLRGARPVEEVAEAPDLAEPFVPHYRTRHRRHGAPVAVHHHHRHHR